MGDRVEPVNDSTVVQPPVPQIQGIQSQDLRRATDFLLDNVRIGDSRTHYDKYRRYVVLYSVQMFNSLVSLYEAMFRSQWQHFKRLMDVFLPPPNVQPQTYAARIYISHWFVDLYCSIREAVRVISPLAFNERYSHEYVPYSTEYDGYLSLLNAAIKPTHIQLTTEDTLYIPVLSDDTNWHGDESDLNPFGINNFKLSHDIFYGLLMVMKAQKVWKLQTLSTHTTGRASWLFDWHDDNVVCAWFPRERNYNDTDVALAYIIGVACSPKLGPRDVDDWQFPPPGVVINVNQLNLLPRVTSRRFFGAYEVRTLDQDNSYILPDVICDMIDNLGIDTTRKRKLKKPMVTPPSSGTVSQTALATTSTPTAGTEDEVCLPPLYRIRIVDWCYCSRVIVNIEWHTRTGALRTLCMS